MERVVRAFPILKGKEDCARDIARELAGPRAVEAAAFYAQFGVTHECWHLQETPAGMWIIVVTEVSDMPVAVAAADYASSERPFDRWFKSQVLELTGIDPAEAPLGPPTECILNWPG